MFVTKKQIRLVLSLVLIAVLCMVPIRCADDPSTKKENKEPAAASGSAWYKAEWIRLVGAGIGGAIVGALVVFLVLKKKHSSS